MATQQYFALDSLATGYSDALAALATATSTNRGYTVTQVVRSASHDSDIKIVCAYVDESDLTGDTVNLHEDNFPSALCVDRFIDLQDVRERGFHLLGEAARADNPLLTAGLVYVIHGDEGSTGGDGKTLFTAKEGFVDVGSLQPNTGYYVCGPVYFHQNGTINLGSQGRIAFTDGDSDDEIEIRCDHPLMPGVISDHFYYTNTSVGQEAWAQDGANPVYSQSDYTNQSVGGPMLAFGGDFPCDGTSTDWHDDWILEQAVDLDTCRSTPSSFFLTGSQLYVHLHDGASPTTTGRRIIRHNAGYHFYPRQASTAYAPKIRFINCQMFGHGRISDLLNGSSTGVTESTLINADKVTFEGGRYIWSRDTWFGRGGCSQRSWMPSSSGRILWDTSDRKNNPATSEGIQGLIEYKGTAADAWDDYKKHVEIGWVTLGPHPTTTGFAQTLGGNPTIFTLEGYYPHHIMEDTKGLTRNNDDGHPVAIRGGHENNPSVKRMYAYRVPNGLYFYVPSNAGDGAPVTGSASNCYNYEIADIVIDTHCGNLADAGGFGVLVGGDNDTIPQDDGTTGIKNGTMDRICLIDFRPTGSTIGTPSQEQSGYICGGAEDTGTVNDLLIIRSNWCFRLDRSNHVQAFSSVQMVDDGTPTDHTTTIIEDTNTPLTLDISATKVLVVGRKQGKHRRIQIRLTQNGAGTAVVGYYYQTASGLVEIPATGFTDGTNGLKQSGTITFTKPADWIDETIGTREAYHVHVKLKSGSWTTSPIMDQCRGVQTGFYIKARGIHVFEPEVGVLWCRANTFFSGAHVIDIDEITIRPKASQDPDTYEFFRFGTVGDPETAATFQARTKLAANTDADFDSTFAPSITFLDPLP